jgi:peroxiredoxin
MNRFVLLLSLLFALSTGARPTEAGKYNLTLNIGDAAPTWTGLPGTDGQTHTFSHLKDADVIVVVFTCNSCPYAVDHEDRLIQFHEDFAERNVALVAINVNRGPEDQLDAMRTRALNKGFPFAYLYDETQGVARAYGAGYTPEFFVLNRDRHVVYMGAMDDSPDGSAVQVPYVAKAVEAALSGRAPEVTETVPIGCRVRYQRAPRSRDN